VYAVGEEFEEEVGRGDEGQRGSSVCRQVPQVEDGAEGRVVAVRHADRRGSFTPVVQSRSSSSVVVVVVQSAGVGRARDANAARQMHGP